MSDIPVILFGFLLGLKHALDVDHLAAIAAIVPGGGTPRRGALAGFWWGAGHTAALLALGGSVLLLDIAFPPELALLLEFAVGVMLAALGVRLLVRLRRGGTLHAHRHLHAGRAHSHPHLHARPHGGIDPGTAGPHHGGAASGARGRRMPLLVGMVHGLAGSAGLALALLPAMPSKLHGIAYLALVGLGSLLGMTLVSWLASFPLAGMRPAGRSSRMVWYAAACLSLAAGAVLMTETGGSLLPR